MKKLEGFYGSNQKIIAGYTSQVEKLEDFLFERQAPGYFMDLWFDLKREISRLDNYYYRNSIVFREFLKVCDPMFGKLKDEFTDVSEDIQYQMANINSLKSRLDGVHHYHDSIKTDRLNKTLLSLTVISGIFLPLNLIVGFFGMNTPGLYFMNDVNGTQKVVVILVSVLLVCLLGIKLVQLIDHYLLRFVLGRYSFYKNLTQNLEDFGDRLRGKIN